MASNIHPPATAVNPDTPITVKVTVDGHNRKFKLPLKELTAALFEEKLRSLLQVPQSSSLILERYSDSVGTHVTLKTSNPSAYKQLYRAAKAKLKLRIRATIEPSPEVPETLSIGVAPAAPPQSNTMTDSLPELTPNQDKFAHLTPASPPIATNIRALTQAYKTQAPFTPSQRERTLPLREVATAAIPPLTLWRVFCNSCETTMENVHFHCSICDAGDYDLCEKCVNSGVSCPGEGHWLIKRFSVNGKMINSTTERIAPKARVASTNDNTLPPQAYEVPMPGSFKTESKAKEPPVLTRTCNSCVGVVPESLMVNCIDCEDYDICMPCHLARQHGHHPGHTFKTIDGSEHKNREVMTLCAPGRNFRHAAICDGCNIEIRGVRYKCLNCPDWDYCNKCHATASVSHPEHRFAPLYDSIGLTYQQLSQHWGIYCDGPLCKGKTHQSYIKGIRYKCAVCHDTDFCANCEAHPNNKHNDTHPLIKFRTQVTNVSVTTIEESNDGRALTHGDKLVTPIPPPAPMPALNPGQSLWQASPHFMYPSQIRNERDAATSPMETEFSETAGSKPVTASSSELDAHFLRDRIADGSPLPPSTAFMQSWTLKNPGPNPWPVGCSVRSVGGDNMLNLDTSYPSSIKDLNLAQVSNATTNVVEVGQEATFVVVMRTPAREGRQISYWRLKAPDGTPFGHKLWCDVEVKKNAAGIPHPPLPWCFPPNKQMLAPQSGGALADYQMQLMLLEQQNKKRLMMARAQQGYLPTTRNLPRPPATAPSAPVFTAPASSTATEGVQPSVPVQAPAPSSEGTSDESASSTMVFPKLEKESPASSTHLEPAAPVIEESLAKPSSETAADATATVEPVTFIAQDPEFEDDESLELDESEEDEDEDDGFLTDEEYDILDASDEEIVNDARY